MEKFNNTLGTSFKLTFDYEGYFEKPETGVVCCKGVAFLRYGMEMIAFINAKGIAKCAPGDKYDSQIGRKIAAARMELDAYRQAGEILEAKYQRDRTKFMQEQHAAYSFVERKAGVYEHNKKYINELLK